MEVLTSRPEHHPVFDIFNAIDFLNFLEEKEEKKAEYRPVAHRYIEDSTPPLLVIQTIGRGRIIRSVTRERCIDLHYHPGRLHPFRRLFRSPKIVGIEICNPRFHASQLGFPIGRTFLLFDLVKKMEDCPEIHFTWTWWERWRMLSYLKREEILIRI